MNPTNRITTIVALFAIFTGNTTFAYQPIPRESGWNGSVIIGGMYMNYASNMVSGIKILDFSEPTIGSLNTAPAAENTVTGLFKFDIKYNFTDSRTQLFLGDSLEDLARFDYTTQAGVLHELSDKSIIQLSYLFSGIATEVWSDPYVVNQPRSVTDRSSSGFRLGYSKIAGSGLELDASFREIRLASERSGLEQLGLNASSARLLSREGYLMTYRASYVMTAGQHFWTPEFIIDKFDSDGAAMAYDTGTFKLTHNYNNYRFSTFTTITIGHSEYDQANPIFGKVQEDDTIGASFFLLDRGLFGSPKWSAMASIAYLNRDANMDFYTSDITILAVGAVYSF